MRLKPTIEVYICLQAENFALIHAKGFHHLNDAVDVCASLVFMNQLVVRLQRDGTVSGRSLLSDVSDQRWRKRSTQGHRTYVFVSCTRKRADLCQGELTPVFAFAPKIREIFHELALVFRIFEDFFKAADVLTLEVLCLRRPKEEKGAVCPVVEEVRARIKFSRSPVPTQAFDVCSPILVVFLDSSFLRI